MIMLYVYYIVYIRYIYTHYDTALSKPAVYFTQKKHSNHK